MPRISKRVLAIMDPEEKSESMKERKAEKKNPKLEKKEQSGIKKTGTYKGKSNKLGGGGQFAQLTDKIKKNGVSTKEAKAIAAIQGRKKYGAARFQKMAAAGRKRASKGKG